MLWPHSGDAAQLNSVVELDMEMLISVAQLDSVPQILSMEKAQYTQVPCHYRTVQNYFTVVNNWPLMLIHTKCVGLFIIGLIIRSSLHLYYGDLEKQKPGVSTI